LHHRDKRRNRVSESGGFGQEMYIGEKMEKRGKIGERK
jgi:hypothetical protein